MTPHPWLRNAPWLIFPVALLARVAFGIAFVGLNAPPGPGTDADEYETCAWNLSQGRGYRGPAANVPDPDHPTAFRPPGTSAAWAPLHYVFGRRYDTIRVLHAFAGAATAVLIYLLGKRCHGRAAGILAGGFFAINPTALFHANSLMSETLATLWLTAHLAVSLRFADDRRVSTAILAGLLLGAAILTRPNFALLIPLHAVWAFWIVRTHAVGDVARVGSDLEGHLAPRRPFWRGLAVALAIPAVAALCLSAWVARNRVVMGAYVVATVNGGPLLSGNNDVTANDPKYMGYELYEGNLPQYKEILAEAGLKGEVERDRVARRLAWEWVSANTDKLPRLLWHKFLRSWTPFMQPHTPARERLAMLVSWGPILVLFAIGVFPALVGYLRDHHAGWLLHLALLGFVVLTLVYYGCSRFRAPYEPACVVIAAATLARLVQGWPLRRSWRGVWP